VRVLRAGHVLCRGKQAHIASQAPIKPAAPRQIRTKADIELAAEMNEELTTKVVAWATETASYAVQLPSRQARDDYLAERRRELVAGAVAEGATEGNAAMLADACVSAARRIMTELLAQRAGVPQGRA
jgi:hypothetical protein